jgi:hypothetical protein
MNNNNAQEPKNVLPDLIIPILAFAFAVYYLTTITEVPWISQASAMIVSCLLALSILAFAIRTIIRIKRGEEQIVIPRQIAEPSTQLKRVVLLILTIAYVYLIESLGFTLTTFAFIFCGIILLSSLANWKNALMVALTCATTGYVVFIYFFQTRFPKGFIENYLEGLL